MKVQQCPVALASALALMAATAVIRVEAAPRSQAPAVPAVSAPSPAAQRAVLDKYCVGCHNERRQSGKMRLDNQDITAIGQNGAVWEKVVRKLRGGVMPPPGNARPDPASYETLTSFIEGELDRQAAASPNPGRTEPMHRLNRTEYRNAVRDVLALDMDFTELLPIDDSGGGEAAFDNIASSLRLTQTLIEQYLSVALKVARTAVGSPPPPAELIFKVSDEIRQDVQLDGLPFGTRGGIAINHIFPVDGDYAFKVEVAGRGTGRFEVAIDGERIKLFEVNPGGQAEYVAGGAMPGVDPDFYTIKVPVKAGAKVVTVAFIKEAASMKIEHDRTPLAGGRTGGRLRGTQDSMGLDMPGIDRVIIAGPVAVAGKGDTPSRRRIFACRPSAAGGEEACAKQILGGLARRAYRRPLTAHDSEVLMGLYKQGRADGDFETGVERGIRGMLVNPNFLLRVSAEPTGVAAGKSYRVSDLELASRLSFFLWSSVPDEALLTAATSGTLRQPLVLEKQVRRMLADPKAASLTTSFASQWLWVRNLKAAMPSETIFPNFDEGLRRSLEKEIELFFASVVKEDRSVVTLIDGDYTFLNERLAKHYGIPNITGDDFRRVPLAADSPRRGILGKGLLLLVTSRSTRTSPVVRGKWILENLLGTPPPAPPANVPPLPEQKQSDGRVLTVRELMAKHRANPVCASCHGTIDPAGFALEQFDAVGKWRTVDTGFQPIDASGTLPDGTKFGGINDFRSLLLSRKQQFIRTMTGKMMMYALGRGLESYDGPALRKIVRDAATTNYKFSSLVLGIVKSAPFQMRVAAGPLPGTQTAMAAR